VKEIGKKDETHKHVVDYLLTFIWNFRPCFLFYNAERIDTGKVPEGMIIDW